MISARLIRECADLICIPICNIFNQSIGQGIFPDDWTCASVAPLFKAGDRNDVNNYRPISVISIVAKVFERIVYDQLYAYLEEHSIICKYQSGFRSTHSTVTALLEATDTWAYNIDRGKINAVVFLDLKKAFSLFCKEDRESRVAPTRKNFERSKIKLRGSEGMLPKFLRAKLSHFSGNM